ncbi:hypothetical protein OBBRIDRAFT_790392 [Obba rivulosa]|uniref:Pentacotripeptide-repeat region of PRORP domain-containing protein n=1 Tax=Obba rivulosa TaxID=1052685 RepID=A0A8E2DP81_9APHY|nr:hypothetical protein OBBRIDRAFT_790392 [Obba rivulosa]
MLPKVASHLLHHTSRAVAAAQNQTGYTIRNVLQLQSSSSPSTGNLGNWNGASSSNSGWNGHGAGPGGAKYQSGSRYHTGYSGAGRAVTQADTSSSYASAQAYNDDSDEHIPGKAIRPLRPRRSSLTFQDRTDRDPKLALLKTAQFHARAHHTIAQRPASSQAKSSALIQSSRPVTPAALINAAPGTSVRHEATAATNHVEAAGMEELALAKEFRAASTEEPVPVVEATHTPSLLEDVPAFAVEPQQNPSDEALDEEAKALIKEIKEAGRGDKRTIVSTLEKLMDAHRPYPADVWTQAMIIATNLDTASTVKYTMELYKAMLAQSVAPTGEVYHQVIGAYARRDHTIYRLSYKVNSPLGNFKESVKELSHEDNFTAAMTLFQAACNVPGTKLPLSTYNILLWVCAIHRNVDAAIYVFAQLEKRGDVVPAALTYSNLIYVYSRVRDLNGAKEVFEEFKEACRTNRLTWDFKDELEHEFASDNYVFNPRTRQTLVWHRMMEAYFRSGQPAGALALLEQMLDTNAGPEFHPEQVPPPTQATFANIIKGFCELRDLKTARSWFERLLLQENAPADDYTPQVVPTRPNARAWTAILDGLVREKRWDDLLQVLSKLLQYTERDNLGMIKFDITRAFSGILTYLSEKGAPDPNLVRLKEALDVLAAVAVQHDLTTVPVNTNTQVSDIFALQVLDEYIRLGHVDAALQFVERVVLHERACMDANFRPALAHTRRVPFGIFLDQVPRRFLRLPGIPLQSVLRLARLSETMSVVHRVGVLYLRAYWFHRSRMDLATLSAADWYILLTLGYIHLKEVSDVFVEEASALPNLKDIAQDMIQHYPSLETIDQDSHFTPFFRHSVVLQLRLQFGDAVALPLIKQMGVHFESAIASSEEALGNARNVSTGSQSIPLSTGPSKSYHIDPRLGKLIDDLLLQSPRSLDVAWSHFEIAEKRSVLPKPSTLGHMIVHFGRKRDLAKVERLYGIVQELLSRMHDKTWQRQSWLLIENCMIVALAHSDVIDRAYIHRDRIIASGSAPSTDAYGALLLNVTDTTDDASNAMALWNEAISRGVTPSTFMYNNIISKLAKARRADECIVMFQDLKARGVKPTSVTYGAMISALCRVGNDTEAEMYFHDMIQTPGYKARIPPYNTMMQFYTYTKPDRQRVLYYYDLLQKAQVQPTSHTYKILMDAYGTIEPINEQEVYEIFARVTSGAQPLVQGVHWASLINMHGCVKKDLDKAMEIFDSISDHPSAFHASPPLPDATVYESLINVIVSLHRFDLIDHFMQRLRESGIHVTAYIVNIIIKGYASAGDIQSARAFFEAMQDPPQGIAAPHNRAAHEGQSEVALSPETPVYREPSTWEEMIRAELRCGSRLHALQLLSRVQARNYPHGVYSRISNILQLHESEQSVASSPQSPGTGWDTASDTKVDSYESNSLVTQSSHTNS